MVAPSLVPAGRPRLRVQAEAELPLDLLVQVVGLDLLHPARGTLLDVVCRLLQATSLVFKLSRKSLNHTK